MTACRFSFASIVYFLLLYATAAGKPSPADSLARVILTDHRLDMLQHRALRLLSGLTAGTSYGEDWIRDFNSVINGSLAVHHNQKLRNVLLMFFALHQSGGADDHSKAIPVR